MCDYNHTYRGNMMILETLNAEEKKAIQWISLEKGAILFQENEICQHMGIVMQGELAIISYSYQGKEIVFNQLKKDAVFGNHLLFSSEPLYKGNVLAKTKAQIALISKEKLLTILQTNQAFLLEFLQLQSDFSKELNRTIKLLSFDRAEERFLYYMHIHHQQLSFSSVSSLAASLFLTRETMSRVLSHLVKQKKIVRKKNTLYLL